MLVLYTVHGVLSIVIHKVSVKIQKIIKFYKILIE